jgi:superoxide reductase
MLSSLIKSADWKAEKHVPVITVHSPSPNPHSPMEVEVSVGKEIPHPNTLEHHIAWAALYFVADGSQLPVELARAEFRAHGPDLFTAPVLKATIALPKSGTLHAVASCNIHGLWESEMKIAVG